MKASPQGGLYFPEEVLLYPQFQNHDPNNATATTPFLNQLGSMYVTTRYGSYVDQSCRRANLLRPGLCWDATFLYPYLSTPLFYAENKFDDNKLAILCLRVVRQVCMEL